METKAVRIHGKMDLRLETVELPDIGPDDVRIKIISDSLCMSTYKAAVEGPEHKRVPNDCAEHPTIVGHEFCGEIVEVGENWKHKYHPGQGFSIQPGHFWKGSQMAPATAISSAAATPSTEMSPLRRFWPTVFYLTTATCISTVLWPSP